MEAARRWRTNRILRFSERQARERSWINFRELAELYGRNVSVSEGFKQLQARLAGEFDKMAGVGFFIFIPPSPRENEARMAGGHHRVFGKQPATIERQHSAVAGCRGDGARLEQFPQCEFKCKTSDQARAPKGIFAD